MAKIIENVSELVLLALEKALQQDGECRLVSKGATLPGLLQGGSLSTAKRTAREQCLDPRLGLFSVRQVEEGSGKSQIAAHFVTITRAGIDYLFDHRTFEQRLALLEKCANPHKEAALEKNLVLVETEQNQIAQERQKLDDQASRLDQFIHRVVNEQLKRISQLRENLERQAALYAGLKLPVTRTVLTPSRTTSSPQTEEEMDFQLTVCRELVSSWQEATDDETRATLEKVMINSGLDSVGEVGEQVAFDGREHLTEDALRPGDKAVIKEPGWKMSSPDGPLLIAKARVSATQIAQEV